MRQQSRVRLLAEAAVLPDPHPLGLAQQILERGRDQRRTQVWNAEREKLLGVPCRRALKRGVLPHHLRHRPEVRRGVAAYVAQRRTAVARQQPRTRDRERP